MAQVIDVPKWDLAEWLGVLYMVDNSFKQPPVFGLIFRNERPAVDIFAGWRSTVGREDEGEQIRISIVEGEIPRQDFGYTVHITVNPKYLCETAKQEDLDLLPGSILAFSRVFRMNPDLSSKNLSNFKRAFSVMGTYLVIPVIAASKTMTPATVKPRPELGIIKKKFAFRNVANLGKGDIDSVVFTDGL